MTTTVRGAALDSSLSFLRDLFRARVLRPRAICIHGREAARLFDDRSKLELAGAAPHRVASLATPESVESLVSRSAVHWRAAIRRWARQSEVVLFDEATQILTQAACGWVGVPVPRDEVPRRARQLVRLVDVGPRVGGPGFARVEAERWIERVVDDATRGRLRVPRGSALDVLTRHTESDAPPVDAESAVAELLDVLRTTVAVASPIVFAAQALHEHPSFRERIARDATGSEGALFVREVRRFYPVAPHVAAVVKRPFEWRGHAFTPGARVLLDVNRTNHDPSLWEAPDEFRPERFRDVADEAGDEIATREVGLGLHFLTRAVTYDVAPGHDLRLERERPPAHPRSGLVLTNVRPTAWLDAPVSKKRLQLG